MKFEIQCFALWIIMAWVSMSTLDSGLEANQRSLLPPVENISQNFSHGSKLAENFETFMEQMKSKQNNVEEPTNNKLTHKIEDNEQNNRIIALSNETGSIDTSNPGVNENISTSMSGGPNREILLENETNNKNIRQLENDQKFTQESMIPPYIDLNDNLGVGNNKASSAQSQEFLKLLNQAPNSVTTPFSLKIEEEPKLEMKNGSLYILNKNVQPSQTSPAEEDRTLAIEEAAKADKLKKEANERHLKLKIELNNKKAEFTLARSNLRKLMQKYSDDINYVQQMRRSIDDVKRTLKSEAITYKNHYSAFSQFYSENVAYRQLLQKEYTKNQILNEKLKKREAEIRSKNDFLARQLHDLDQKKVQVKEVAKQLESHTGELSEAKEKYQSQVAELQSHSRMLEEERKSVKEEKDSVDLRKKELNEQLSYLKKTQNTDRFLINQIESEQLEEKNDEDQLLELKKTYKSKLEELLAHIRELEGLKEGYYKDLSQYNVKRDSVEFQKRKINEKEILLNKKKSILETRERDLSNKKRICQCEGSKSIINDLSNQYDANKLGDKQTLNRKLLTPLQSYASDTSKSQGSLPRIAMNIKSTQTPELEIFKDPYFNQSKFFSSK
jgi:hypothetical protein